MEASGFGNEGLGLGGFRGLSGFRGFRGFSEFREFRGGSRGFGVSQRSLILLPKAPTLP